jgi:hypothetical protein
MGALAAAAPVEEQGVFLNRVAEKMISAVASSWIPPNAMNALAWMARARAVVNSDAKSQIWNAGRLMPAAQRAVMRWEICGT